jgi:hypothetical protein
MRHLPLGMAAIVGVFVFYLPASWSWHLMGIFVIWFLFCGWVLGAMGRALLDVTRPRRRERMGRRELDRAWKAGRDHGAAAGPSVETLQRWRRQGFGS